MPDTSLFDLDFFTRQKDRLERIGDVSDVVFVSGGVVMEDSNELYLYYGAADDKVAVAMADMDRVREYIMACPEVEPEH